MASMFEQINQAVVRFLEARRGTPGAVAVALVDEGFVVDLRDAHGTITPLRVRWDDVQKAAAVLVPGAVGGDECLLVDAVAGLVQLTPAVSGFDAFVAAAPGHLAGWKSAAQWRTELIAAEVGTAVPVYR